MMMKIQCYPCVMLNAVFGMINASLLKTTMCVA